MGQQDSCPRLGRTRLQGGGGVWCFGVLDWVPVRTEASEAESVESAFPGCPSGVEAPACAITSRGIWSFLWDRGKGLCREKG